MMRMRFRLVLIRRCSTGFMRWISRNTRICVLLSSLGITCIALQLGGVKIKNRNRFPLLFVLEWMKSMNSFAGLCFTCNGSRTLNFAGFSKPRKLMYRENKWTYSIRLDGTLVFLLIKNKERTGPFPDVSCNNAYVLYTCAIRTGWLGSSFPILNYHG